MNLFKVDVNIDLSLIVEVTHYKPARPAPACSNPSDPAYADSGDPCELEYVLWLVDSHGNKNLIPDEMEIMYDMVFDSVLEEVEERKNNE